MQDINNLFDNLDIFDAIGVGLFLCLLFLLPTLLVFLFSMHNKIIKQLDPILFKEPWFNASQLIMFQSWPLSFFKSVNYMLLIGFPALTLKTNKFHDLKIKDVPAVSGKLKMLCKIYSTLHIFTVLITIIFFIYIVWYFLFNIK